MTFFEQDLQNVVSFIHDKNISLSGKSFLITGATGLVGSILAKSLVEYRNRYHEDLTIHLLIRNQEKAQKIFGDLSGFVLHQDSLLEPLHLPQTDYVIHCAAVTTSSYMKTNPVETFLTTMKGTEHLLAWASENQVQSFVYVSSMEVYGVTDSSQNPYTEDKLGYVSLTNPRSCYPESKRAAEMLCRCYFAQYALPVKIARLAQTFGAGVSSSDPRVFMQFTQSALRGEDLVLHTTGQSVSNFVYTSDAACGLFTVLFNGQDGEAYNVCHDGESRTIAEIAQLVCDELSGGRSKLCFDIPEGNAFGYASDTSLRLSSEKLKQLGWQPRVGMAEAYQRLAGDLS